MKRPKTIIILSAAKIKTTKIHNSSIWVQAKFTIETKLIKNNNNKKKKKKGKKEVPDRD